MARTPLLKQLVRMARIAHVGSDQQLGFDAAREALASRRKFLGAAGGALALGMLPTGTFAAAALPSVAIVGGGLAGLTCAYRLKRRLGLKATVYEANTRLGGRCHTDRTNFGAQIAEHGGELIDTGHKQIRRLAQELGLELDDMLAAQADGAEDFNFFDGARYDAEAVYADFRAIYPQLQSDIQDAPFPTTWDNYTARGQELDQMSIDDWITAYVPGGLASRFGQLLSVAYEIEYGVATAQQSALNMLYLLGFSSKKTFEIFGESDERFHIRGGNDLLVSCLADALNASQLQMRHRLTRIAQSGAGYLLDFSTPGGIVQVQADHVVLALPFSILRSSVDYSQAGFDDRKRMAIEEQPHLG